jgi:hypothetical protein
VHVDSVDLPTGETAGIYHNPDIDRTVSQLTVDYAIGQRVSIAGVAGFTVSAMNAARQESEARLREVARKAAAAKADLNTSAAAPHTDHERTILRAGRLYRIDLEMVWAGELFEQTEAGGTNLLARVAFGAPSSQEYKPKNQPLRPTPRSLFFRTADKPKLQSVAKYGEFAYADHLFRQQAVFQPEMLQRYLAGYEPAQSEEHRFCGDPLRAHFLQSHVARLADAYGFTLMVSQRRVDRPGPKYAQPNLFAPVWTTATNDNFLAKTDRVRADFIAASVCQQPRPGATATVDTPLEPQALYEVYVLAKSQKASFADGRLPGVTFTTSRWITAEDMFVGLGLSVAGLAPNPERIVQGDLAIAAPASLASAVIEGDDQAFQDALLALGIEAWPISEAPRLSRMWLSDGAGGWLFAGLMLESPEPVHRPGRLELQNLTLAGVAFDIRRRDRSGARLLYLTSKPFQVLAPASVELNARSTLRGTTAAISGSFVLPQAPEFAEEP